MTDEELPDTEGRPRPSPAPAELVGAKVADRYDVVARLGGGGFGDVYKAFDLRLMSRPVVVKVLKEDVLKEEEETRDWLLIKFQQEVEALSKIINPGVVGVFDAGVLPGGQPYLVMEFVEGCDLRSFFQRAREGGVPGQGLRLQDVAEIVRQTGRALTAAHERHIIHRDLKPENIMLSRGGDGDLQVKVIDFGIAKVRNSLVAPSTAAGLFIAGTWQYMSPEQLHRKRVEPACDVYALGVIAYEMVTGRHPFAAKDPARLKELQEGGVRLMPRDLNPDLPAAAQDSILKALAFYPAERHARARDFGDELARALADEEDLVRPVEPVPPLGSTLRDADAAAAPSARAAQDRIPTQRAQGQSTRPRAPLYVSVALMFAAAIGLVVWIISERAPAPGRALTYWLTIKRPRDAKPFESTGRRVFDSGSQFWFNVQTTQEGALYLFGEGHSGGRPSEMNTLFPTPRSGQGDARLAVGKVGPVTEGANEFRSDSGVIYLWVVWAAHPIPLLDDIVKKSYDTAGTVNDPSQQVALRTFIDQQQKHKPQAVADELNSRVTLKGPGEVLVGLVELEYQP